MKKKESNLFYDFVYVTGYIPMALWMRPKRIYMGEKPNLKGPILISSNHRGFIDPAILLSVFPSRRLHCIASKDLYKNKLLTTFFNHTHCIKIDKTNFSLTSFHTVIERLDNGCAVVIFPEGQLNTAEEEKGILPFKAGISLMAYKGGAPILPVYIVKREKWYHRQVVVIGDMLDIHEILGEHPSLEQINNISNILREKEVELLNYYESKNKKSSEEREKAAV